MRMDFDTGTRTWEVCVDTPLRVTTSGADGRPLTELDLHVGARVHVLGRWVTLRQATRATAEVRLPPGVSSRPIAQRSLRPRDSARCVRSYSE